MLRCLLCTQRMLINANRFILHATVASFEWIEDPSFQYTCIVFRRIGKNLVSVNILIQLTGWFTAVCNRPFQR